MTRCLNIAFLLAITFLLSCKRDAPLIDHTTQKLVIVLVDGPRWTETGGDNTQQYQPYLRDSLAKEGCVFTNFYNNGVTFTVPGHAALLTGHYQNISNGGNEYPMYPSLGQTFLESRQRGNNYSWLISSKDKIEVFKSCRQSDWDGMYTPRTDCGINGNGTGYRMDSVTFEHARQTLQNEHPDFLFIGFKEPDASGHTNNWTAYLDGIKQTDQYAWEIWKLLQSSPYYKGVTTFVITNDHGRHIDGWLDGFISHGDTCIGCRHINLFMAGPGIKKGASVSQTYEQIDLHKTLSRRFGLFDEYSDGKVIREINAY
jgi:hypothetical protein